MSDRLPYEEHLAQQWNDLPLPDENRAWDDMKRRLEEDDDKPIIPIWLRGCGLWGLLSVVLIGLGWWCYTQYTSNSKKEEAQKTQNIIEKRSDDNANSNASMDSSTMTITHPGEKTSQTNTIEGKPNQNDLPQAEQQRISGNKETINSNSNDNSIEITTANRSVKRKKQDSDAKQLNTGAKKNPNNTTKTKQVIDISDIAINITGGVSGKTTVDTVRTPSNNKTALITDSSARATIDSTKSDSSIIAEKDSLKKKNPEEITTKNTPKKDSAKQKSISFSAGIAENQLLPIDGQKLTPYNAQGRKSTLADYIPSVYFRMYKDGKWFLQSEFRYGAPQYNREFKYSEKSAPDSSGGNFSLVTSSTLKKTFYHQLPVSFNYFVLPNWSVGTGFVWNMFKSAVSTQDVVKRTNATGSDTVVSLGTVVRNTRADSNFAKSYFQGIIETQYKWKRFSLGARYAFGLEPYIKFTLPGGTQQQEKNRSLQIFLRYELWKSKKIFKK